VTATNATITNLNVTGTLTGGAIPPAGVVVADVTDNFGYKICFSDVANGTLTQLLRSNPGFTFNPSSQRLTVQNLTVLGTLTGGGGGGGGGGVTVIDSSSASTHKLLFTDLASGNTTTVFSTDSSLIYNPSTNNLSCGGNISAAVFVGPLNGTASLANQVVTATDGSDGTRFITFTPSNHLSNAPTDILTSGTLRYNPAQQLLTVTNLTVTGTLTGGGGGGGGGVTITDTTAAGFLKVLFTGTTSGGTATSLNANGGFFFNPATGNLVANGSMSASSFVGPLIGTASSALQVTTASDDTTTAIQHIAFSTTNNPSGAASTLRTSTSLTYLPSAQLLTVPNLIVSGKISDANRQCFRFNRNANTQFWTDAYVILTWDSTANEILIRQATARPNVWAMGLTATGGTYMSGQNMLLSINDDDFYFQSGTGQVDFSIISEVDAQHPTYRVHATFPSSSGTSKIAVIVEKF
jgi:hypothetical protein